MPEDCKIRLEWVPEAYKTNYDEKGAVPRMTSAVIDPRMLTGLKPLRGMKQIRKRYKR